MAYTQMKRENPYRLERHLMTALKTITLMRVIAAFCFAVFLYGMLMLMDAAGEAFADSFDARPGGAAGPALNFAPIGYTALLIPMLAGFAYRNASRCSQMDLRSLLWHLVAALLGGLLLTGAWVVRWFGESLNGAREIDLGRVVGNTLAIAFLCGISWFARRRPQSRVPETGL